MSDDPLADALLITPLHRAVYKVLLEAGFTEGREGQDDTPPIGMASIVTMTLSAYPSEDQLIDAMTWGQGTKADCDALRPVARKLLALVESGAPPA